MMAHNSTDRMMATIGIAILSLGACYAVYSLRPVYWRFYATVIRPFEDHGIGVLGDDPFSSVLDSRSIPGHQGPHGTSGVQVASKPRGPFNPDDYPLSRERVHQNTDRGYIMVTWTNDHYIDFAISWVNNIRRVGLKGYMVGAMDDDALKNLWDLDITTWRMNTNITKKDLGWGSHNFHKMGRFKINLIKQFLQLDVHVIISDIDTAWMRDPLPYFDRYPDADILTSSDELRPTVKDESLERFPQAGSAFNIGIMVFRPTSRTFVDVWIQKLDDPKMWDQNAFNDIARKGHNKSNERGLWRGFGGNLTFGVLPVSLFASGHVFFVQRKYEEFGLQAFVAHATFQYSGTPGKRHRFREFMLFTDPPSYYDHPKGFLRYDVDIPADFLSRADGAQGVMTEDKIVPHFDLVNHQLTRLRNAIAVASITGRVLVMPPLICGLDKYWGPLLHGSIPGSQFKKPFVCPMDHVLDLEGGWNPRKDEDHFGPHVEWREYSFFNNPRMSRAVNESRLKIEVCPVGTPGCAQGGKPEVKANHMKVSAGLNSAQLAELLQGLDRYKVLDFTTMADLFVNFTDAEVQARYERRLKHYTSVFCCINSVPGWIWYDFFWDTPHTDRFNRKYDKWDFKKGDKRRRRQLLDTSDTSLWEAGASSLLQVGQQAMLGSP